jgi:hypothetical protein
MSSGQAQSHVQEERRRRLTLDSVQDETVSYATPAPDAGVMRKVAGDPKSLAPNQVLQLQRLVGNRTVQKLLAPQRTAPGRPVTVSTAAPQVQMLRVDAADTQFEEEADQIAEAVVQGKRLDIQRSANGTGPEGGELDSGLERQIKTATGGGSLPGAVRNTLEPKLGVDLKGVKVHTGAKSVALNRQLNAKAFTYKNNIFYCGGQSPNDLSLTAHEVVHTMHQGAVRKKINAKDEDT